MKVTDKFGNELQRGSTVAWQLPNGPSILGTIIDVDYGGSGILLPRHEPVTGKVVISVEVDFTPERDKDVRFGDMTKTFNPKDASKIARALSAVD